MTLENINAARVQDAIETLTDAEKHELDEFARKLRTFAAGDVLAQMEYHDGMLARWGDLLADETLDDETRAYGAYDVTDHRRRREICGAELARRNHADRLPSGGARSRITRELIDEIKTRVDLVELMQARGVELKTRGERAQGRCPFHEDKTPSLSVDNTRGLWHCFGCNAGGDAIKFVMQFDRVDFIPALRILAERAGVELPTPYPAPRTPKHKTPTHDARNDATPTDAANYLPCDDILTAFGRAETGDAEILARLFADQITYDHAENAWYLFRRHFWERDVTSAAGAFVANDVAAQYLFAAAETKRRVVSPSETSESELVEKRIKELYARANGLRFRNKIANVLALASSQPVLALRGDEWDKDAMLLGVANGVIVLRASEFEFRDGAPRDFIRTAAPTQWNDLHTPAPRFEQFLQEIFAGDAELIAFVQRLLGYGITGETSEHVFPVLWGEGRNGKDTLLESLAHVLGEYAAPVTQDVLLENKRDAGAATPHLWELRHRRIVWVSETNEGARLNAGQVKWLTGGGRIKARQLYGKLLEFVPRHLLLLVTNHKPHANADDYALWKRLLLIPFTQAFVDSPRAPHEHQRDAKLAETLRSEASGILAWLVRGCLEWQRVGLNPPACVTKATDDYQTEEDTLSEFIAARCLVNETAETKAAELYAAYRQWATDNGLAPMSGTAFGKRVGKKFEKQKRGGFMVYVGIRLSPQ